ncbi:hypothetical protein [Limnohabitans sp.]
MERFFLYVQRFNTVVIGLGLLFIVGLAVLGGMKETMGLFRSEQKTVEVPHSAGNEGQHGATYSLHPTEYSTSEGTVVFRLQSWGGSSGGGAYAEGRGTSTRNLLFLREGAGKSLWLFPDQTKVLARVEGYKSGSAKEDVLLIETEPDRGQQEKDAPRNSRDVYLVRMDGTGMQRILTGVEETLNRKTVQGQLQIVYQNADAVRMARYSLRDFRQQSDVEVVKIETLRK